MDFGRKISNWLWQDGIIPKDDMEIVQYGISQLLSLLLNLFTLLCICFLCGTVFQGMVFLVLFWPMRIYAGGYHAKSKMVCTVLTYLSILVSLLAIFYVPYNRYIIYFLLAVCICVIVCAAPVESENKPLSKLEKRIFY